MRRDIRSCEARLGAVFEKLGLGGLRGEAALPPDEGTTVRPIFVPSGKIVEPSN
jgi:hypothetical protein